MARISEINYSNAIATATGNPEFIEVALSPAEYNGGVGLGRFEVCYYVTGGTLSTTVSLNNPILTTPGASSSYANPETIGPLAGTLVYYDADADEYVFVLDSSLLGMKYSVPDNSAEALAVALVDTTLAPADQVLEFIDLDANINENPPVEAVDGPAAGLTADKVVVTVPPDTSAQWNQPDPDNVVDIGLTPGDSGIVCFAAGTLIATPRGPRPVERLRPGDRVTTLDRGPQPVRWAGRRALNAHQLAANPKLRPIRIQAGALAPGVPTRDLLVSRQHRLLVGSKRIARRLGAWEVLVAAKQLVGRKGVEVAADVTAVSYHHLLFDRHEILIANGAPAESLYPGPQALAALGPDAAAELIALFPDVALPDHSPRPARRIVKTLP